MLWNHKGKACNKNLKFTVISLNRIRHIKSTILQLYSKRPMYTNNIAFFNISFTLSFHINYILKLLKILIDSCLAFSIYSRANTSRSNWPLNSTYVEVHVEITLRNRGRRYNIYYKTIVIVIVLFINYCLSLLFVELCNVGRIKALNL
ncbi:hypothetical protein V1477_006232 [Vespula maculifrons]|uniref:Uncharacterized protein n=1 Tax=Vespula maculifrons TaxID=7453 RepID=A0ABD2CJV6_VESMC